jgi:hypothetical protein
MNSDHKRRATELHVVESDITITGTFVCATKFDSPLLQLRQTNL